MKWKDTTSYSRGQEQTPTCWSAKVGQLRITVLSSHRDYPGAWVMHCHPFFDTERLGAETKEEAQAEAILLVRQGIQNVIAGICELEAGE